MPSNFISITGQPLELGPESRYRGQYHARILEAPFEPQMNILTEHKPINLGQCQSIHDFEKLNQLGEGSKNSTQPRPRNLHLMLILLSLRRGLSCARQSYITGGSAQASPNLT